MPGTALNDDEARTIRALIATEDDSWDRGDAVAYARPVQDDCVFTNIFGQVFVGRDAFQAQHQAIFDSIYKGTRLVQKVVHLRFLRPDVVAVDSDAELTGLGREPLRTKLFQLFIKNEASWSVAVYHNVRVQPPPRG
jgi:uncharacterized protein (TIGR02246 family)